MLRLTSHFQGKYFIGVTSTDKSWGKFSNFLNANRGRSASGRGGGKRARSLSQKDTVLPDQIVTISLPGSKRPSRQASVDRDSSMKRSSRSSSMEVFTGEYRMKMPAKTKLGNATGSGSTSQVTKISSDHYSIKANTDEEAHAQATFKLPPSVPTDVKKSAPAEGVVIPKPPPMPPKPPPPPESSNKVVRAEAATAQSVKKQISSTSSITTSSSTTTSQQISQQVSSTSTSQTSTTKQETHVQGHSFNITKGLRRSQHGSKDDVRKSRNISGRQNTIVLPQISLLTVPLPTYPVPML